MLMLEGPILLSLYKHVTQSTGLIEEHCYALFLIINGYIYVCVCVCVCTRGSQQCVRYLIAHSSSAGEFRELFD
ncbi:hypothetical protein B7P43_G11255 [Cryptotermes secundus]|uniref:Uncharacterized protein n=1 Tax=Cryptotermes secundus TaxID=105785 RepID=A0A2J7R0U4_9NEOP|nr:hypothetical protein B7P43_G11255 [Cryptotermes secundus]